MAGQSLIQLLILDYGGVYSFEYQVSRQQAHIEALFGQGFYVGDDYQISHLNDSFSSGLITTKEYIDQVAMLLKARAKPSVDEFESAMISATFPPSHAMVKLVREVRKMGIKVALLSDICSFEISRARLLYQLEEFEAVFLSAEHGTSKNHPEFFQLVFDKFQVQPECALFVDDREKYITIADKLGMKTLLANKEDFANAGLLAEKILNMLQE